MVCISYRYLALQSCSSHALQLILFHFVHMELPECSTVNMTGSCSEILDGTGGNVLVSVNTSSTSQAEEQDGAQLLNYHLFFFFCSPRPCYSSILLKDCLGTDCTKKIADAVLYQCCNFCFHFSPYVVRINHLCYLKHFWSLFLYHILDFVMNSSSF